MSNGKQVILSAPSVDEIEKAMVTASERIEELMASNAKIIQNIEDNIGGASFENFSEAMDVLRKADNICKESYQSIAANFRVVSDKIRDLKRHNYSAATSSADNAKTKSSQVTEALKK